MTDKPFKQFERVAARLVDGTRFPANTGGPVDVESEHLVVQCKNVAEMSLSALTAHALAIEAEGVRRKKRAILCVKLRSGKGVETPTLFILTAKMWADRFPEMAKEVPSESSHDLRGVRQAPVGKGDD